ncbi:MAG: hypothetical protein AAB935_01600 [Patescibacteria group bacterium]
MKQIYKILIILVVIVVIAIGVYLSWKKIIGLPNDGNVLPPPGQTPNPPTGTEIKKISEQPVFDFWLVPDTGEIYYLTPDGKILSAKDGPDLEISTQTINALNFIEVGPGNQKILAAFGSPRAPQWGIFDLIDKVWRPLPADITNATWGAKENELIAILKTLGGLNLATVDLSKTPPNYKTLIKDFRLKDVRFTLAAPERLIITELPSANYTGRVWQLDLKTLTFNLILAPENGLTLGWSQDKNVVFKFSSENGFSLFNQNFQETAPLFFSTLPTKCETSGTSTIYCFVPQDVPDDVILPDDYFQNKFYSVDDLYTINLETDETKKIFKSSENGAPTIDGKKPKALSSGLYFINRYDNYLYELKLL